MPDPPAPALPDWPPGTVCVLATAAGGEAHAIPVSTALRVRDDLVLLALGRRRAHLARLRAAPAVALAIHAPDLSLTVRGTARVLADPLPGAEGVAAVGLTVEDVQDHRTARFAIEDGVQWRWTDDEARERDAVVRAALLGLGA